MLLDLLCNRRGCLGSMYKTKNAICGVSAEFVQGWRLEVKGYPRLTEHGAWRGREGPSYGGFYSQEEVRM